MFNRLNWIATSYLTCPATLALLAVSVVLTIFAELSAPRFGGFNLAPTPPHARPAIYTVAELKEARRLNQQAEIKGIDLQQLFFSFGTTQGDGSSDPQQYKLCELLDEFPNLEWVDASLVSTLQDFPALQARLAKLKRLEYLNIDLTTATGDLSWLKGLPKLRRLDVTRTGGEPNLAGLAELPALETLALTNVAPITKSMLAEIAPLPHLKTLILAPLHHPSGTILPPGAQPASTADFAVLRSAPNLQAIYFGQWHFGEESNPAEAMQAVLPAMVVRPASVQHRCDLLPMLASFICSLLAGALAYQLAIQFQGATGRLLPGFALPHALIATIWWIGAVATTTWLLAQIGFSAIIALALAAAVTTGLVAAGTVVVLSIFRTQPTNSFVPFAAPGGSLMLPFLIVSRPWWFEVYRGATLWSCGLATVGLALWLVYRLRPQVEMVPDLLRSQRFFSRRQLPPWRERLLGLRAADWAMDVQSTAPRPTTWWQRIARWRLGNANRRSGTMALLTPVCWILGWTATWAVLRNTQTMQLGFGPSRCLALGSLLVLWQGCALAGGTWWSRARTFSVEALRPSWDRDFRRELAAALALDVAPAALIFAAGASLAWSLETQNPIDWSGLPVNFLIFLAFGYSAALAPVALCVVVRRAWLAILVALGVAVFCCFAVPYAATWQLDAVGQLRPNSAPTLAMFLPAVRSQLWIPILLASLLVLFSAWRWRTMELADSG
jgi:hypothetical protein